MVALAGCAAPPPATVASGGPAPMALEQIAVGDWDDADAAVRTAARLEQIVIESRRAYSAVATGLDTGDAEGQPDDLPGVLVYTLRTARGDEGELMLKRLDDGRVRVRCRLGALGSERAEAAIVARVVERLGALSGRDYAPIRD